MYFNICQLSNYSLFYFFLFVFFNFLFFFFFNDTATTEIYTLSLHDALPICMPDIRAANSATSVWYCAISGSPSILDRKSTRLNSSHSSISYAVFCLKKKKKNIQINNIILKNIF